jgi:hypothetical protein
MLDTYSIIPLKRNAKRIRRGVTNEVASLRFGMVSSNRGFMRAGITGSIAAPAIMRRTE